MINKLKGVVSSFSDVLRRLDAVQQALGRIESRQLASSISEICASEFKVYSQWGEDGIIQFLLRYVSIENKIFVEFGVENYTESNTRFLLINNNWSGLVLDGSEKNISYIKRDPVYWRHNLKAVHAFIDKDNIDRMLEENGVVGDIGLLSIDIDGNDYWVWAAVENINPRIVVVEYNYRFGRDLSVTVPYDSKFDRRSAHYSMIYYGASLRALVELGARKGYAFLGCNSNGVNAFFVKSDLLRHPLQAKTVEEGYVSGKHRESRNENGELNYLSNQEERDLLTSLPLVDVSRQSRGIG